MILFTWLLGEYILFFLDEKWVIPVIVSGLDGGSQNLSFGLGYGKQLIPFGSWFTNGFTIVLISCCLLLFWSSHFLIVVLRWICLLLFSSLMSLVAVLCKFLVDVIISYGGPLGIQYLCFPFMSTFLSGVTERLFVCC